MVWILSKDDYTDLIKVGFLKSIEYLRPGRKNSFALTLLLC